MITVISRADEIRQIHRRFHQQVDRFFTERVSCSVGYPSGSFEDKVRYSSMLDIWMSVRNHNSRNWNGFGIGSPIPGRSNTVRSEINFPHHGINRSISGVFAMENNGNILILHRGKLGGNTGIRKAFVMDNYRGDFVTAIDGDRETEFLLVGELDSPNLPEQIATFAREVDRIKNLYGSARGPEFDFLRNFQFTEEARGGYFAPGRGRRFIDRRHGIIVSALSKALMKVHSLETANTRNIDLFIHRRGTIKLVFEIKSKMSSQGLATALGQLLLYTIPIDTPVRLAVVLPEKLKTRVAHQLAKYNVVPLYFNWNNGHPIFENLPALLKSCSLHC